MCIKISRFVVTATKFNSEKSTVYTPNTFRTELTELHSLYEKVLFQITIFPKAGEVNWRVLEMVDQVMFDWDVLGGGTAAEMRELTEVGILIYTFLIIYYKCNDMKILFIVIFFFN